MLGRLATVADNKRTQRDHLNGREVTVVAAHAGGFLNRKLFFTVMWQPHPRDQKFFFTYPAGWLYYNPQPTATAS